MAAMRAADSAALKESAVDRFPAGGADPAVDPSPGFRATNHDLVCQRHLAAPAHSCFRAAPERKHSRRPDRFYQIWQGGCIQKRPALVSPGGKFKAGA